MSKNSKWMLISLILILSLVLAACGGNNAADTTTNNAGGEETAWPTQVLKTPPLTPVAKKIWVKKLCCVFLAVM